MALSPSDRKLLWGKAANRCAICRTLLSRPGGAGDPEIVVGEEAHIVGEKVGAARYRPLPARERDGYTNRILLCPNDHTMVDKQPMLWPEERLREVKAHHERTMALRTAEARRQGGIEFEQPGPIALSPVLSGGQLARMMGEALAYTFEYSELEGPEERIAADLFQSANDWGDIYGDIGPSGHADAAEDLGEHLRAALAADLVLLGEVVHMNVRVAGTRDRWPVVVLWIRRMQDFAAEVKGREAAA